VLHLRTLGESVIEVGGTRIGPSAPHLFAVLLYLGLEAGRRIPRARLQELLFPNSDERSGSHSLRQLLYRVRRLGAEINSDRTCIVLTPDQVRADFQQLLAANPIDRLDLGRVREGFVPGFCPTFSRPFGDWLEQRRAEIQSGVRRRLVAELGSQRRADRWPDAEATARALLSLDPLNEEATIAVAEATALSGSKVEALRLLDTYLQEVGARDGTLRMRASVLRRCVAERLPQAKYPPVSRMVGRDQTLQRLREALGSARAGHSLGSHIWGEIGIGKTRLVNEFARAATLRGARVEQVSAQPHDIRRPMAAFTDLVPALLSLPGALGCSPGAMQLLKKLVDCDGAELGTVPHDIHEAELLSANITRSISELLDALAAESLIVMVFDDAQWLDPISLRVISDLLSERKQRRLMVLLTSRESSIGVDLPDAYRLLRLPLDPLEAVDSRSLLMQLLAAATPQPDSALIEWCLAVAGGNPFFLHSLAAHYLATGSIQTIPEPLAALLNQRLGRLDGHSRRIFEACSVLGRHSTLDRLEAMLGVQPADFLDGLQSLEERGFVRTSGAHVFSTHALLSEVAITRAPPAVRAVLHRNAARILEAEPVEHISPTLLWDCAEHWLQAGAKRKALAALHACGRHALRIGRPNDACEVLLRATQLTESARDVIETAKQLIVAGEIAERWDLVLTSIHDYSRLAAQGGSPLEEFHEYRLLELEALIRVGTDAASLVPAYRRYLRDEGAPSTIRIRAASGLAVLADELMSPSLAAEAFEAASRVAVEPDGPYRFGLDIVYYVVSGKLDQAIALARSGAANRKGTADHICRRLWLSGFALLRAGVLDEGCAILEECFHRARDADLKSMATCAAVCLACVLRDAGQATTARGWHSRAAALATRPSLSRRLLNHLANCVLFALDEGDFAGAKAAVRQAADIPACRTGLSRLIVLALEVRVKQLADSYDCSNDELNELLEGHRLGKGTGHHDEVVVTIWNALVRKGRTDYANALVGDFVNNRRIRWPLSPELRAIKGQLDHKESAATTIGRGKRSALDRQAGPHSAQDRTAPEHLSS
jgi:DNA-binding SARP family transcriptional activator